MKRLLILLCACTSLLPVGKAADNVIIQQISAQVPVAAEKRNLDAEEAARLIKEKPEITILDVRTPGEYAAGHVQKALNINYNGQTFQKEAARLDTRKTYLIYCASGYRSLKARIVLTQIGITNLYHLDGGIKAWQEASFPIVK